MFNEVVKIGSKKIGKDQKIYIIGDVGLTNNGSLKDTFKLINILSNLGVDAIKFQMIGPEVLLGDKEIKYTYPTLKNGKKTENMFSMFSNLSFSSSEWKKISKLCKKKKIEFICTSHFSNAVDFLEKLKIKVHKICTWSQTHRRMIEKMGQTRKPLIIDTGAYTKKDFNEMVKWYRSKGGKDLIVLHDFHTKNEKFMNFKSIPYIKKKYKCVVGYTPQGRDDTMDLVAIGLGAQVIEKRITLDRSTPKNGHFKALEVEEFKNWLNKIKKVEVALGKEQIIPTPDDIKDSKKYFKSLYVNRDIKKGEILKDYMIEERRPGTGISAKKIYQIIGKKIKKNLPKGKMISFKDII